MIVFILLISTLGTCTFAEPRCSSFDYVEKTLDKMIRTEHLVKDVKTDIESVKKQTSDAVNTMEILKAELQKDFNSMLEENNKKIAELQGNLQVKPNVLFLVKDPTTQSPGVNKVIVFGTIMSDTTSSYDKTSGKFTVPVDGANLFTAQLCLNAGANKHIYYAIVVGEDQVANSLLHDGSHRFCNTAQAVVNVKKGQTISIMSRGASSTALRANYEYEWCTFSGVLIN